MTMKDESLRNKWLLMTWGIAVVAIFTLCLSAHVAAEEITLRIMSHLNPAVEGKTIIDTVNEHFTKRFPNVTVEYVTAGGWGAHMEAITLWHAGGTAPDIFMVDDTWRLVAGSQFALDLTPYYERDQVDESTWFPGSLETFRLEGKLVGLPLTINPTIWLYNKNVFDELGLADPLTISQADWTWDTVADLGTRIARSHTGDEETASYGLGGFGAPWKELVLQYGATMIKDNRLALGEPNAQAALSFLQNSNYQQGGWWYTGGGVDPMFFDDNRLGLLATGYWIMNHFPPEPRNYHLIGKPTLNSRHIPEGNATGEPMGLMEAGGWLISKDSEHPDLAWELVKYMAGDPLFQETLAQHLPVASRDGILSDTFTGRFPTIDIVAFFNTAMVSRPMPKAYITAPTEATAAIEDAIRKIANGEMPPKSAIDGIDGLVNAYLQGQ